MLKVDADNDMLVHFFLASCLISFIVFAHLYRTWRSAKDGAMMTFNSTQHKSQYVYIRNMIIIARNSWHNIPFEIPQNGQFTPYLQIGRTLYENDDLLLSQTLTADQQTALPGNFVYRPFREKTVNMLKHRLLVFLYRRAAARSLEELRRFFQHFDSFRALRIWKMQMLDDQHFLLKYASEDVVTLRSPEPNLQVTLVSSNLNA